ncbi:MAG TPA: histidine phosphatase family protein [Candidatus Dormibacteraeota bacterium]|nr:histidine phosphatase family protein [Candidatus Dormibacteraeota bacterium]
MLTLVLTRHGLTARSDPEQHLGQHIDIGLSEEGREQAMALAGRIADERFDRIVCSPLRRARETAEAVAAGRPIELDARLLEMDYGRWEGLTYEGIEAVDAAYRAEWEADPARLPCPGGESADDVAARARSFVEDLLRWADGDPGDRVVLAVAHSSLNRILLCVAMCVPLAQYRRRFTQAQVNITALRYPDGAAADQARLLVLNDLGHVRAPGYAPWELRPGA